MPNRIANVRTEVELLLCCAHVNLSEFRTERIQTMLKQEIDWQFMMSVAHRNRMQSLLYLSLNATCPELVPTNALAHLQRNFRRTTIFNFFLTRELMNLLDCLTAKGLQVIPYKGPVLAHAIYGNAALRQFGDLDILVPERDAIKAREILCAEGFVQTWPEIELTKAQEEMHVRTKYNYALFREKDGLMVELHWGVTPRYINFPPDSSLLWERLESISLAGKEVLSFPTEELLLILCAHGANHCWNRLCWVCDVAELIRLHPDIDWEHLLELAHSWRGERMLLIGLHLAHMLLDAELPRTVSQQVLADPMARELARQSCKWLFSEQYLLFEPFEEPLYHLKMLDSWDDRLRYCLEMLRPTSRDWTSRPLPRPLHFLYFLLRPFRLGIEHGLKLLRSS